jgi:hypothetical protein
MNPFMQWSDGGRRFKCNVCGMGNEAPPGEPAGPGWRAGALAGWLAGWLAG